MAARIDTPAAFPLVPRNSYYLALKLQHEAQSKILIEARRSADAQFEIAEATRGGKQAQEATTFELNAIRKGLPNSGEMKEALASISGALGDLNGTVARFDRRETDYVTALYGAVIDTTGDIVGRTNAGQWMLASAARDLKAPVTNLADIAALNGDSNSKVLARKRFIEGLMESAAGFPGLPTSISQHDLERFVAHAPSVLKALSESTPPPAPAPLASTTTAPGKPTG